MKVINKWGPDTGYLFEFCKDWDAYKFLAKFQVLVFSLWPTDSFVCVSMFVGGLPVYQC